MLGSLGLMLMYKFGDTGYFSVFPQWQKGSSSGGERSGADGGFISFFSLVAESFFSHHIKAQVECRWFSCMLLRAASHYLVVMQGLVNRQIALDSPSPPPDIGRP